MSDTSTNRFNATGTTAERTAFVPDPATATPSQGYTWWDTDLQALYAYDFGMAAWVAAGGGGSGTVTHTAGALTANQLVIGNGSADIKVTTTGTGIVTALGINTGSAGAPVLFNGALGTPSSGTATNLTGLPATTGLVGVPAIIEGRLTTESGVPVSTSDRTAQGTIYWKPCTPSGLAKTNGQIALYNGSAVVLKSITQISLAITIGSGKNKNVYIDYNSGTPQIVLGADWTDDTTPSETLADQNGLIVLNGTAAYRYVGVIRADGANTVADSGGLAGTTQVGGKRFVWNAYNQVARPNNVIDTTDLWAYTTNTIRQANAATGNKVEWVTGDAATQIDAFVIAGLDLLTNSSNVGKVGIGIDSTSTFSGLRQGAYNNNGARTFNSAAGRYLGYPGIGYHFASWNEKGADGSGTPCQFVGDNGGDGQQSGLYSTIWN